MHHAAWPIRALAGACRDPIEPIPLRTVLDSNASGRARSRRFRVTPPCRRGPYRRCCSLTAGWVSWSADATRPVRIQVSASILARAMFARRSAEAARRSRSNVDADLTRLQERRRVLRARADFGVFGLSCAHAATGSFTTPGCRLEGSQRRAVIRSNLSPCERSSVGRPRSSSTTPRSDDATLPSWPISAVLFAHGRMGFLVSSPVRIQVSDRSRDGCPGRRRSCEAKSPQVDRRLVYDQAVILLVDATEHSSLTSQCPSVPASDALQEIVQWFARVRDLRCVGGQKYQVSLDEFSGVFVGGMMNAH